MPPPGGLGTPTGGAWSPRACAALARPAAFLDAAFALPSAPGSKSSSNDDSKSSKLSPHQSSGDHPILMPGGVSPKPIPCPCSNPVWDGPWSSLSKAAPNPSSVLKSKSSSPVVTPSPFVPSELSVLRLLSVGISYLALIPGGSFFNPRGKLSASPNPIPFPLALPGSSSVPFATSEALPNPG